MRREGWEGTGMLNRCTPVPTEQQLTPDPAGNRTPAVQRVSRLYK
jgi:hypothetical protein